MNYRRISAALLILSMLGLLVPSTGCRSVNSQSEAAGSFESAPLAGMIYTSDGRPVQGARIIVDATGETRSDVNGRFVTAPLSPGQHQLVVVKSGFEDETIEIDFTNRLQVLYISLSSFEALLRAAEDALDAERLQEADHLLKRAAAIEDQDPVFLMLQAASSRQRGDLAAAVEWIRKLEKIPGGLGRYPKVEELAGEYNEIIRARDSIPAE